MVHEHGEHVQHGGRVKNDGPSHDPVLQASGITKSYRRGLWPFGRTREILSGVDLVLHPGEVVGLTGENGSGKSTLMKILVGELRADQGTLSRNGRLGYCPQAPLVYDRLTCDEHFDLFGRAYGMPGHAMVASRDAITPEILDSRRRASRRRTGSADRQPYCRR